MKKKFYREAHGFNTQEEVVEALKEVKVEIPVKEEEAKKEKKRGRKYNI